MKSIRRSQQMWVYLPGGHQIRLVHVGSVQLHNSGIQFRFNGEGADCEVIELVTDSNVHWRHSGTMPEAWMGTEVSYRLQPDEAQTYVLFLHENRKQSSDFMGHCSIRWAVFMLCLKQALETGKGRPHPHDIHIDHDE